VLRTCGWLAHAPTHTCHNTSGSQSRAACALDECSAESVRHAGLTHCHAACFTPSSWCIVRFQRCAAAHLLVVRAVWPPHERPRNRQAHVHALAKHSGLRSRGARAASSSASAHAHHARAGAHRCRTSTRTRLRASSSSMHTQLRRCSATHTHTPHSHAHDPHWRAALPGPGGGPLARPRALSPALLAGCGPPHHHRLLLRQLLQGLMSTRACPCGTWSPRRPRRSSCPAAMRRRRYCRETARAA
jgi:hypothetical protein